LLYNRCTQEARAVRQVAGLNRGCKAGTCDCSCTVVIVAGAFDSAAKSSSCEDEHDKDCFHGIGIDMKLQRLSMIVIESGLKQTVNVDRADNCPLNRPGRERTHSSLISIIM
jgi:hypothetical protein